MKSLDANLVTAALLAVVAVSLLQGIFRGAGSSAKRLFLFVGGAAVTLASVVLAAWAASAASAPFRDWLDRRHWTQPKPDASGWSQFGYTLFASVRDLPLLRFAFLFLIAYLAIRLVLGTIGSLLIRVGAVPMGIVPSGGPVSRAFGGLIGAALGCGRALLLTAALFAYCSLFPQGPYVDYVSQSGLYREAAAQIIRPAAGSLFEERLPVFAKQMQGELDQIWQKRYDVIDADLPPEIVQTAQQATEGKKTDEEKARALYDWVGSHIEYDNDKVTDYEEKGEWHEQTPAMTYDTHKGVCIDYARLFAAMARSVGLEVRVITGLGYDGLGGYGAHAWNEVYLSEQKRWIPLDATWAHAGDWFDPPNFRDTHIASA
ncbi:transglutaminase-like domain-containing protein [Cohnella zeiphila]|uniref:Transglutaminase domain-containing protein n=1 Tax=Cohnella zeiphila TaxID=2761120 RepID=A0A7X0SIS7_9BACL|nr:transglutaminase-like domain-containing protein [Cohnella zeiphila]MBB6730722.1 transglutaminase domain-containing protein [Cohnella zeiphila]